MPKAIRQLEYRKDQLSLQCTAFPTPCLQGHLLHEGGVGCCCGEIVDCTGWIRLAAPAVSYLCQIEYVRKLDEGLTLGPVRREPD